MSKTIMPELYETITVEKGLELCKHFGLDYLVKRIEAHPEIYRDWEFDGCSWYPDKFFWKVLLFGKGKKITYECCLPHDLAYAYGEDIEQEREKADSKLRDDLINKAKIYKFIAQGFYLVVRAGGGSSFADEGDEHKDNIFTDFKWKFAHKYNRAGDLRR